MLKLEGIVKGLLRVVVVVVGSVVLATPLLAAPRSVPFDRPAVFEPNRGQAAPGFQWIASGTSYRLLVGVDGLTMVLPKGTAPVRMSLAGGRPWDVFHPSDRTGGTGNYFVGDDPKRWLANIPQYAGLEVAGVYPDIDLVLHANLGGASLRGPRYDFVVGPGADPSKIRLQFAGVHDLRVDAKTGALLMTTSSGSELRHLRPAIYQEVGARKLRVSGGYSLRAGSQVAFHVGRYDHHRPLIIDPTIDFTTFLGGSEIDWAAGVAVDGAGNSYVTGNTFSSDFPGVAFPGTQAKQCAQIETTVEIVTGGCDTYIFVAKLSPTGVPLFSVVLGGSAQDQANAIAVDSTGVYIAGFTFSPDFPFTNDTYSQIGAFGSSDVFVLKLSLSGDVLLYSTIFGGKQDDGAYAIAVDPSHFAYVTGYTRSDGFPTFVSTLPPVLCCGTPLAAVLPSPEPLQDTYGGGSSDAFVAKLGPDGSFDGGYSTYLGGSGDDWGYGIAVDTAGFAYVVGSIQLGDFPVITQSYGPANAGNSAFLVKLAPNGSAAAFSTLLRGGQAFAVAVDGLGNSYLTGSADWPNFPTTPGAFQSSKPYAGFGHFVAFAAELSDVGVLRFATFLGGTNGDTNGLAIAAGRGGGIYVAGSTASTDFPQAPAITPHPTAGFLVKFMPGLSAINYTVFLGYEIRGVALLEPRSVLAVLGSTQVYTAGSRLTAGKASDAFVVKLDERPFVGVAR